MNNIGNIRKIDIAQLKQLRSEIECDGWWIVDADEAKVYILKYGISKIVRRVRQTDTGRSSRHPAAPEYLENGNASPQTDDLSPLTPTEPQKVPQRKSERTSVNPERFVAMMKGKRHAQFPIYH